MNKKRDDTADVFGMLAHIDKLTALACQLVIAGVKPRKAVQLALKTERRVTEGLWRRVRKGRRR